MSSRFRNEQKYLLSKKDAIILQVRLEGLLEKDEHLGDRDSYLIRSIYFDDPYDGCLREKIDGVDDRKKWRIRSYDCDDSVIHLECKEKLHGMTRKESTAITRSQLEEVLSRIPQVTGDTDPLWNQFALKILTEGYRPVTIVQYIRTPLVWQPSNVRITFDTGLASSEDFEGFFDEDLPVRSIMPEGMDLLEVKFDTLLPDHLRHAMNLKNMAVTSFSKYELCRRMPMYQVLGGY